MRRFLVFLSLIAGVDGSLLASVHVTPKENIDITLLRQTITKNLEDLSKLGQLDAPQLIAIGSFQCELETWMKQYLIQQPFKTKRLRNSYMDWQACSTSSDSDRSRLRREVVCRAAKQWELEISEEDKNFFATLYKIKKSIFDSLFTHTYHPKKRARKIPAAMLLEPVFLLPLPYAETLQPEKDSKFDFSVFDTFDPLAWDKAIGNF